MGNCCGGVVVTPNEEDSSLRSGVNPDDRRVVDSSSYMVDEKTGGVRRIKVVITKKELQRLLTKQISVEKVVEGIFEKRNGGGFVVVSPAGGWKPKLESILEGNE